MKSTDHAARLRAVLDGHIADGRLAAPRYDEADVVAVLGELKQLREEHTILLDGNQRLQIQNAGLRRLAVEAREVADGWHQATIELYTADVPTQQRDALADEITVETQ